MAGELLAIDTVLVTFDQWAAAVRARGGVVTRMPAGATKGQLCARFKDAGTTGFRYELAPLWLRVKDNAEDLAAQMVRRDAALWDAFDKTDDFGRTVAVKVDNAVRGTLAPVDNAVNAVLNPIDTIAKESGLSKPIVMLFASVMLYAALVNAGILPPLRRLVK